MSEVDRVGEFRFVLFDVMGTVVDVDGGVRRDATGALERFGLAGDEVSAVVDAYPDRLAALMGEVTAGAREWQGHRDLRRLALRETVDNADLPALDADAEDFATGAVHRLDPWPDSVDALRRLRRVTTVVALSNADLAELAGLSRYGGLSWHAVLSGEHVRAFKPDPAVYQMALRLLAADPATVLMVAAHPWDLRAAAEHGMATAYVPRPGADGPESENEFDLQVRDLAELATLLRN